MIAVCGEALVDLVSEADGRLRPAPGGGPFNTARALGRLGTPVVFLGRISTDAFGRWLFELLDGDHVDVSLVSRGDEPTALAVARLDGRHAAAFDFYHHGTSAPNLVTAMLPGELPDGVTAIHLGSLGLALEPMATTLFGLMSRECSRRVIVLDPNVRPPLVISDSAYRARLGAAVTLSTIVKASQEDVRWMYPGIELEAAAGHMLESGARLVVITLGADGAAGFTRAGSARAPAPAVDVVNTIGAGDAFGAALMAWLHQRDLLTMDLSLDSAGLKDAVEFSCRVASLACEDVRDHPPPGFPEIA